MTRPVETPALPSPDTAIARPDNAGPPAKGASRTPSRARYRRWSFVLGALGMVVLLAAPPSVARTVSLSAYNVDINEASTSGLSSGGFMAMQFAVAYSSVIKGAGVLAGGPYDCAQGSVVLATTVCSCTTPFPAFCATAAGRTGVPTLIAITERRARERRIDPVGNLARQRIFLFAGTLDTTVPPAVMDDLRTYAEHFAGSGNVTYKNDLPAAHALPTPGFGNPCGTSRHPYINRCGYDAAGALLAWIYGGLNAPGGTLGGSLVQFSQDEFLNSPAAHGMDDTGWMYVPAGCARREACRLHIVFHGCRQGQSFPVTAGRQFGTTFVRNAGYNRWADRNGIVVLYPQAVPTPPNPRGCWDWWGYDDPAYATQTGRQMAAVKAMVDRIAGGRR